MFNLKVYGCEHCGSIFQSKSAYGFEPKHGTSCGTTLIQEMSKDQLQSMLMSNGVLQEVKDNIIEMMALMPTENREKTQSCITCMFCKAGKDDHQYPYSFHYCEKNHFGKAKDDVVELVNDCSDYARQTELQKFGEILAPFFEGTKTS